MLVILITITLLSIIAFASTTTCPAALTPETDFSIFKTQAKAQKSEIKMV